MTTQIISTTDKPDVRTVRAGKGHGLGADALGPLLELALSARDDAP